MQRISFLIAYLFVWVAATAQQYPFVYYTPKDGLVNSRVRSIKQDSKGRMYFITYGGLSVYDGVRFINYRQQDGLPDELVNDLVEITPDSILIATNTNKLNTLVHGRIGTFKTTDNFYPLVNHLLKSSDGRWYAVSDDGFFLLDNNKFTRLPFNSKQGKDLGHYLDKIIEWKNFFLIIPWNAEEKEKLILYDRNKKQIADTYSSEGVVDAEADKEGNVWIGTASGIKLLDTSALERGKINICELPLKYATLSEHKNASIFFDSNGNAWSYSANHIFKISRQGREQVISPEEGLQVSLLLALFEDQEGIIWIATDGNGVVKMRGSNIELFSNLPATYPLSASAIQQVADTTWLYNNTIHAVYRICSNEIRIFPSGAKNGPRNIYIHNQKLYMANDRKIVCIRNKDQADSYKRPETIINTSDQNLSFGNGIVDINGALIQHVKKGDNFFLYVFRDDKMLMEYKVGYSDQMVFDKWGKLWVATRDNHLMIFTIHPEQPSQYLQLLKDYSKELPDMGPRCITIDRDNIVWIGTRYNGIYRLEFSNMQLHSVMQYTTRNGLTDNFVYSIMSDANNNIWTGTQSGLDRIFLKNGQYIISNISKSNNYFQSIHYIVVAKDNVIWALTGEGAILKITPEVSSFHSSCPPLLLTLIQVNNQQYDHVANRFSSRQNNFSFGVAAASFTDEKSILYSYQLEGSGNNNWSVPSNNAYFNFSNLGPGRYTLYAKAEFPGGMYAPRTASYTFIILPPWWQTWWFRSLSLTGIAGIILLFVRAYTKRKLEKQRFILEKQQVIEKERTRIATDMHDDLGAGLSRIKFLSETIGIKKQQQIPIEEDIGKIREYAHEMIDKMGEIVWALNEKNDSISDLISYTRSYAVEYLSQNGIACRVTIPEILSSTFVSGEFRRNIFLSVKESLHNIVKHAQANQVLLSIEMTSRFRITIHDDGIGFNPEQLRPFSNGITNIKKRMSDIGGTFEINCEKGTTISLAAPWSL